MENLQEKLEAIATYAKLHIAGGRSRGVNTKIIISKILMQYLTSLDWLHPVAMKVKDDLSLLNTVNSALKLQNINKACCLSPNSNGEYTDLFNAVYDGILFINQYKNK